MLIAHNASWLWYHHGAAPISLLFLCLYVPQTGSWLCYHCDAAKVLIGVAHIGSWLWYRQDAAKLMDAAGFSNQGSVCACI